MTTERFYVKGSRIKQENVDGWFTVDEVCQLLNTLDNELDKYTDTVFKQDAEIVRLRRELREATDLLYECDEQFRKYDGRKLVDTSYVEYSEILTKIMAMTI